MSPYPVLLRELLSVCEVRSRSAYRWFDRHVELLSPDAAAKVETDDALRILHFSLKNVLYANFYCTGRSSPIEVGASTYNPAYTSFLSTLSEANTGTGSIDPGWHIVTREHETLIVERHGLRIWARPHDLVGPPDSSGDAGNLDTAVALLMPKEFMRLSPGFYLALGNTAYPEHNSGGEVRYYLNLEAEAAASAMRCLTGKLNAAGIPFRFKVIADPAQYRRTDAGVLYARARDQNPVRLLLDEVCRSLDPPLKAATPALTLRLADGLGFAESPADPAESFGTARCALLASALVHMWQQSAVSPEARFQILVKSFRESGVLLEYPFRAAAMRDDIGITSA